MKYNMFVCQKIQGSAKNSRLLYNNFTAESECERMFKIIELWAKL